MAEKFLFSEMLQETQRSMTGVQPWTESTNAVFLNIKQDGGMAALKSRPNYFCD